MKLILLLIILSCLALPAESRTILTTRQSIRLLERCLYPWICQGMREMFLLQHCR